MVVADELILKIRADSAQAQRELMGFSNDVEKKSGRIKEAMGNIGKSLTTKVTLPLLGAGAVAVKFASDAEESASKFSTVFGDAAKDVADAFDNDFSRALGMSQAEAHDFLGTLGAVTQGLGFSQQASADLASELAPLAADLASFHNVPIEQAAGAITSALTGEREAMKSLGIVINDTMVKEKAFEMGLYSGTGAIDSQAMALATQALITEKAGAAVGDFQRTSDGLANSSRILTADVKDMAAELGTQLIPIVKKVVGWVQKALDWWSGLSDGWKESIVILAGVVAAVGPVLTIGSKLIGLVKGITSVVGVLGKALMFLAANPVGLVIVAVAALVAGAILLIKNWDTVKEFLLKVWNKLKEVATAVFGAITDWIGKQWERIKAGATVIWQAIKKVVMTPIKAVWEGIKLYLGFITKVWKTAWETLKSVVGGVWKGIKSFIQNGINGVLILIEKSINAIISGINALIDKINSIPGVNFGKIGKVTLPRVSLAEGGMPIGRGVVQALVGERGPEVLTMPQGSTVTPAGSSGPTVHIEHMHGGDPLEVAGAIGWELLKRGAGS